MRRHILASLAAPATAIATLALAVGPVAAAPPRLDRSFGLHHGYWLRSSAPWAGPERVVGLPGGVAVVISQDGKVARVAANGRLDAGWGVHGELDPGADWPRPFDADVVPWGDRLVVTARAETGYPWQVALVVDGRGRRLAVTDAIADALPPRDPPKVVAWSRFDVLVPLPDGSLWNLRHESIIFPPGSGVLHESDWLAVLGTEGVPASSSVTRIDPPIGRQLPRPRPVPSDGGLIVTNYDPGTSRLSLLRITGSGATDPGFARVPLLPHETPMQMLPWHGGAVVLTTEGHVLWVGHDGQVLHRRTLPLGSAVALDAAQRLLVVYGRRDRSVVTLRRLQADGRSDGSFGIVRLRAAGRWVEAVGVVPGPGGRVLVLGRTVEGPEDYHPFVPTGTVAWRLRTR